MVCTAGRGGFPRFRGVFPLLDRSRGMGEELLERSRGRKSEAGVLSRARLTGGADVVGGVVW